jgi:hypothetical protein
MRMERSGIAGNGSSEQVRGGSFAPKEAPAPLEDVRAVREPGTIPAMRRPVSTA